MAEKPGLISKVTLNITVAVIVTAMGITGCSPEQEISPNILLILADDLGYSDIGCYGGDIETPHLDKLAKEGIRFTQFYNTARCCPSRASILTGLHPHQTGLGAMVDRNTDAPGYQGEISHKCVTLAQVLGEAGYGTCMAGKWHVAYSSDGSDRHNWPVQRGFDRFYGTIGGAGSFFAPHTLVFENEPVEVTTSDYYYTDAIADTAVSFLKQHVEINGNDPFFMYVAFTAPHWPLHAKPEDIEKYKGSFNAGWDELRKAKVHRMIDMELIDPQWEMYKKDRWVSGWDTVKHREWELRRMEVYAAMVDCMDQGIGRIINYLEESGQAENTLTIFLSDNGACSETWSGPNPWAARFGPKTTVDGEIVDYANDGTKMPGPVNTYQSYGRGWAHYSNTPWSGYKSGTNEGGISTPCIMHWPGNINDKGAFRRQMAGIIDIMPTLVELSGAMYPETYMGNEIIPVEGLSLVDVIRNNTPLERESYFVEHIGRKGMINKEGMKVLKYGKNPWKLYNLTEDRTETNDIAEELPELTETMAHDWEEWAWMAKVLPKPGR